MNTNLFDTTYKSNIHSMSVGKEYENRHRLPSLFNDTFDRPRRNRYFFVDIFKKNDISDPYFDLIHSLDNTLYNTCAKYIKIHILCVVSNVENSEATGFGAPKWDQLFALNSKNLEPQGKQRPHSQRNGFRTLTNVFPPWHGFGCWRAATTNCWEVVSDKLPLFNDAHLTKETTLVNPIHHATRDPKHTKSAGLQYSTLLGVGWRSGQNEACCVGGRGCGRGDGEGGGFLRRNNPIDSFPNWRGWTLRVCPLSSNSLDAPMECS